MCVFSCVLYVFLYSTKRSRVICHFAACTTRIQARIFHFFSAQLIKILHLYTRTIFMS